MLKGNKLIELVIITSYELQLLVSNALSSIHYFQQTHIFILRIMCKQIFHKISVKAVINNVVNIALVMIYFNYFGQKSIKRYLGKAVIITTQEKITSLITHPGKM